MPDSFLHGSEGLSPETSDTNEGHPWKTVEPRRARAGMATRASISKLTHPAVSTPRSTTKSTAQHTKISPAAQQANERVVQAQRHGHGELRQSGRPHTILRQTSCPSQYMYQKEARRRRGCVVHGPRGPGDG